MAAGLGFKTFAVGEVLTAADTNGYLMQGVLVFANATARDAAITSPQEGQFAYLKDTNVTTYYTGSAWANLDTTGMTNPMTTTGDTIYSSSGSTPARLGIGSTGQVLTVAGGVPTWATPASGSSFAGCRLYRTTNQSLASSSWYSIAWDAESFDTNSYHSTSVNPELITIPSGKAGYYYIEALPSFSTGGASGPRSCRINVNSADAAISETTVNGPLTSNVNCVKYLNVGDTVALNINQSSGGTINLLGQDYYSTLTVTYLGV